MGFKNFNTIVIIRVLLIVATIFTLFFLWDLERYKIASSVCGILIIFQVVFLIRYVERTNRKLTLFLQSIRHADFSTSFSDHGLGLTFTDLSQEFNRVLDEFRRYRAEKEEQSIYLNTIVQHVSIGILAFKKNGQVDIINNAVKKLFRIKNLRYIQDLKAIKEDLPAVLLNLKAGDSTLYKLFIEEELLQLSIMATEFRLRNEDYTLVSLQNISAELDEKEIESWQKMIRVLTHEIMNSITPITSLASTVHEMVINKEGDKPVLNQLDDDDIESVDKAILTIGNRSQGLLNFVETYRSLTRIPKPNFRYFRVSELFDRCSTLMMSKMQEAGIECNHTIAPPDLMLTADPDMLDQVIINLILNATDALKDEPQPKISIVATLNNSNRVVIDFKDNGPGIKPDIMDKIFMPFFTSKKHGTGVGLSLSRQIMHLHKGSIQVRSKPGEGTVFTLVF